MQGIQNRIAWGLVAALSLLVVAALAGVVSGGPLDPTGPPGSTGKNVITSLPFTISQPGSYVLNGNLTGVSGSHGINVTANNVTIDLQGFELLGVPGASAGINRTSASNLTVRNGMIKNWPVAGIQAGGAGLTVDSITASGNGIGINMLIGSANATVTNCRVELSTGAGGILLNTGSVVHNCLAVSNAGIGIQVNLDSVISESIARANSGIEVSGGNNVTLENCTADGGGTAGDGIFLGANAIVRGCSASNNFGKEIWTGNNAVLESCVADGNGTAGNGIEVGSSSHVRGCTARNNAGVEISAGDGSRLEDCVADGNGSALGGIIVGADGVVSGCTARNNGGAEIFAGDRTLIENCLADGWTGSAPGVGSGIIVASYSTVRGCTSMLNGDYGIYMSGSYSRIEANQVIDNDLRGIRIDGSSVTVLMNTARQNGPSPGTTNYEDTSTCGCNRMIVVGGSGLSSTTGAWANHSE